MTDHARQLLEKHLGLPFLNAGYSGPAPRMNIQQVPPMYLQNATGPACEARLSFVTLCKSFCRLVHVLLY